MSASLKSPRMTVDAFLAWTETLADDTRYELVDGQPVAMAPGLFAHGEIKGLIAASLVNGIKAGRLPCRIAVDSPGVRVSREDLFIPDVLVHCGPRPPEGREIADPMIVVEVESPSTARMDAGPKLWGYLGLPSVRHYLIVLPSTRSVIHHERREDGVIQTHLRGADSFRLDPPGLTLSDIFPPDV